RPVRSRDAGAAVRARAQRDDPPSGDGDLAGEVYGVEKGVRLRAQALVGDEAAERGQAQGEDKDRDGERHEELVQAETAGALPGAHGGPPCPAMAATGRIRGLRRAAGPPNSGISPGFSPLRGGR